MPDEPKAKANESPVPTDAPTDYPPAGVAVSTGTAWDASIDPATLARLNTANTFTANTTFNGITVVFGGQYINFNNPGGTQFVSPTGFNGPIYLGGPNYDPNTTIQPGGALNSPAITVNGSPVVTAAMLDPAVVNERLAALEAGGVAPPPADDERAQTRAGLTAAAQASQDLADEIFAQQRAEAERVQNIQNPRPPDQIYREEEEAAKSQRKPNPKEK
jgi:hypothetical protein